MATAEYRRAYYHANKEQEAASHRRWRLKAGDRAKARFKRRQYDAAYRRRVFLRRLVRVHGVTESQWVALLSAQSGLCAICDQQMVNPQVDHCHQLGGIRGLLCRPCNVAIGILGECHSRISKAARYIAEYHERGAK